MWVSRQLLCARYIYFSSSAFRGKKLVYEPKIASCVASEKAHTSPARAQSKCSSQISKSSRSKSDHRHRALLLSSGNALSTTVPQHTVEKHIPHRGNDYGSLGSRL